MLSFGSIDCLEQYKKTDYAKYGLVLAVKTAQILDLGKKSVKNV